MKRKQRPQCRIQVQRVFSVLGVRLSLLSFPFLSGQLLQAFPYHSQAPVPIWAHARSPPQQIILLRKEMDPLCKFRCIHHCLSSYILSPSSVIPLQKKWCLLFRDNPPPSSAIIFSSAFKCGFSSDNPCSRLLEKPDSCLCYSSTSSHHLPSFFPCQTTQSTPSLPSLSIHSSIHLAPVLMTPLKLLTLKKKKKKSPGNHNLLTAQSQHTFSKLILLNFPIATEPADTLPVPFSSVAPWTTFSLTLPTKPCHFLCHLQTSASMIGITHSKSIIIHHPKAQSLFWTPDPHFHLFAKRHRPPNSTWPKTHEIFTQQIVLFYILLFTGTTIHPE